MPSHLTQNTSAADAATTLDGLAQQRLIKRIAIGLLIAVGLVGLWVMIGTLAPSVPSLPEKSKATTPAHQAGGTIPAEKSSTSAGSTTAPPEAVTSTTAATAAAPITPPSAIPQTTTQTTTQTLPSPAAVAQQTAGVVGAPATQSAADHSLPAAKAPDAMTEAPAASPDAMAAQAAKREPKVQTKPLHVERNVAKSQAPHTHAAGRFAVQMGAFKVAGNAEKLRARMAAHGVSAMLEKRAADTRVLAGPFATREEAERARAKLAALGMGQGIVVPLKKK